MSEKHKQNKDMPESDQPTVPSFDRPSARVAAAPAPIQRANYGIPPRQTAAPAPAAPRFMDVSAPRPVPVAAPAQPVAQFVSPTPAMAPVAEAPLPAMPTVSAPPKPLFNSAPRPLASPTQSNAKKPARIWPKVRLSLLVIGALLALGGIGRWATAGNTTGDTVAVGAVAANDGRTMTIQFTADDGKIHKFTEKSNAKLIPGAAVQVAYRPGAAEATVKQVAVVQHAHNLGITLAVAGAALLGILGFVMIIEKYRLKKPATALTTPVSV